MAKSKTSGSLGFKSKTTFNKGAGKHKGSIGGKHKMGALAGKKGHKFQAVQKTCRDCGQVGPQGAQTGVTCACAAATGADPGASQTCLCGGGEGGAAQRRLLCVRGMWSARHEGCCSSKH